MKHSKNNKLLTVGEAAKLLRMHINTLRRYIKEGIVPAYKIAKNTYRLDRDELIDWVREHKMPVAK